MSEVFHHFGHLVSHAFVRWYTFLGTSPGGAAAQIITLVITEAKGGWLRLSAWRTNWQGGLKRAAIGLGSVWIVVFAICIVMTIYGDHMSLVAQVGRMEKERDQWEAKSNSQKDEIQQLRNAPPKTVYLNPTSGSEPNRTKRLPQAQTQLDILIEVNKRLPDGDRARLAEALYDFGKVIDQANSVWGKANNVDTELSPKDFEPRKTRLRDLLPLAKDYERHAYQVRQKWHYYERQTVYVFGDNPDNDAAIIENAATEYLNYLSSLAKIQSTEDKSILDILVVEQNQYRLSITRFAHWWQECRVRLEQMRSSVQ